MNANVSRKPCCYGTDYYNCESLTFFFCNTCMNQKSILSLTLNLSLTHFFSVLVQGYRIDFSQNIYNSIFHLIELLWTPGWTVCQFQSEFWWGRAAVPHGCPGGGERQPPAHGAGDASRSGSCRQDDHVLSQGQSTCSRSEVNTGLQPASPTCQPSKHSENPR